MEKQKWHNKSVKASFKNAFNGCFYAFSTQSNFKIHISFSITALFLAWWLQISQDRLLFLILAIVLGLTLEMVNTTFERAVDLITEEYNEKAGLVKDVAAGMMLLISFGLLILGSLILLPPLWQKLAD